MIYNREIIFVLFPAEIYGNCYCSASFKENRNLIFKSNRYFNKFHQVVKNWRLLIKYAFGMALQRLSTYIRVLNVDCAFVALDEIPSELVNLVSTDYNISFVQFFEVFQDVVGMEKSNMVITSCHTF